MRCPRPVVALVRAGCVRDVDGKCRRARGRSGAAQWGGGAGGASDGPRHLSQAGQGCRCVGCAAAAAVALGVARGRGGRCQRRQHGHGGSQDAEWRHGGRREAQRAASERGGLPWARRLRCRGDGGAAPVRWRAGGGGRGGGGVRADGGGADAGAAGARASCAGAEQDGSPGAGAAPDAGGGRRTCGRGGAQRELAHPRAGSARAGCGLARQSARRQRGAGQRLLWLGVHAAVLAARRGALRWRRVRGAVAADGSRQARRGGQLVRWGERVGARAPGAGPAVRDTHGHRGR
mmetsp:Transcript_20808/g.66879  ORF Transcript_20808/g.66879 Transcript_20808/m.66879 type:complete len:291 (-) Transcript_20808:2127-2999(-)